MLRRKARILRRMRAHITSVQHLFAVRRCISCPSGACGQIDTDGMESMTQLKRNVGDIQGKRDSARGGTANG